jgi:hypothetical protein
MNPQSMPTLFLTKARKHTMQKRQPLQKMLLVKVVIYLQKTEIRFIPCTSINTKWIKDLHIRPETLQLVQERSGNTLEAVGIGKDLLNRTPATQQLRERMDKRDHMKLKSFSTTKKCSLN